jgi:hypothetical protein
MERQLGDLTAGLASMVSYLEALQPPGTEGKSKRST